MRKKKNIGALTMADLIGCIRKIVTEELESTEKRMKEEFESGKKRIWTRIEGIFRDGNQASFQRNMKLQFKSRISQKILTGEEIKGEDKSPLELALVDEPTGNIVDGGPESSATVEILLLKGVPNASEGGDWTAEQFNQNIVREAKKPLFAENEPVKLENGIGFLKNIKFRHHAIKMKPSEFRLGARVVNTFDGVHIKEAKTESFVVKDFRNKCESIFYVFAPSFYYSKLLVS
ncbi:hypothetical protein CDL12_25580 [Handroanthus impetiginosus]|uniref:Calmodulin binding protein-like N-terminal domain-containing protein n=1 Tax=Handroanthus impetiginosus TaxID=429701 RepID=A0A2G9G9E1_9LAMI|nr:hypothetical protein CDL12_25580 [Handroanthus impetiginosus]